MPAVPAAELERDYPIKPVPFTSVHCEDHFWAPRIETNRSVTVPFAFRQCETSGRVELFRRAAQALAGDPAVDRTPPGFVFDDTDVYKVIEGAAYTLDVHPDPGLETYVDGLIDLIAAAQEPDGYLYTTRTIGVQPPHWMAGDARWVAERTQSHELYNLGHLYEAAAAYAQATGTRTLLDIALRTVDLLESTFGPGKESIWPGHPITEMALVKLHRAANRPSALEMARFLIEQRGPDGQPGSGNKYNQSHLPVLEQTEAVGHAVRAAYLYAGVADVAALYGESQWVDALDRLWQDVVGRKLYITGGIGATHHEESFGQPYELPNDTAYSETCAAIGNVYWNHRLFLLHGDARYVDVLERSLYNGLLAGVSLDGMAFFYDNPLESDGWHARRAWFGCACCPSNVSRFLPSLPGYVYGQRAGAVYVNLYVAGEANLDVDGARLTLRQQTRYPWEGSVRLEVAPERPLRFALKLRIPGWARDEAVPSDLYRFAEPAGSEPVVRVNGAPVALALDRGYVTLEQEWKAGDVVDLELPMPVRRILAHPRVEADRDRVALQRGPLVYCVEQADNPGVAVCSLLLEDEVPLHADFAPETLGGIVTLRGRALLPGHHAEQEFTAIPYYAWANRGPGAMIVWLRRYRAGAH